MALRASGDTTARGSLRMTLLRFIELLSKISILLFKTFILLSTTAILVHNLYLRHALRR
jgi:hypothetical protein